MPLRRTGLRLALALVVGATTLAAPAGAAPTQDPAAPTSAGATAPTLALIDQPVAVAADGVFFVQLTVQGAPAGSDLAVDIYDRARNADDLTAVESRSAQATFLPEIELAATTTPSQPSGFLIGLYREGQDRPGGLDYTFQLDEAGAYPLRVRLRGPDDELLTTLTTSIVRLPAEGEVVTPAEVAVLTTVHDDPPVDPEARASTGGADPALQRDLPPVLSVLHDRPDLPVSFAVTPDTAARLAGDPATEDLLRDLRTEVSRPRRDLLDAPYVDVDPTSLAAAGLSEELTGQRDLGRRTLADVLIDPQHGSWALHRPIDLDGLAAIRSHGTTRVVLPADAATGAGLGPSRIETDRGEVTTLVAAADLSVGRSTDPVLAAHRTFARLATTAVNGPAALVLAVDPADVDADTLGLVLDGLALGTDLFRASTLDALFEDERTVAPPRLVMPAPQALGDYPARVEETRADLASYASMVGRQPELLTPYERPLALSAAADLTVPQRLGELAAVTAALDAAFASITLPDLDDVTLGSREASFPLTISSTLAYPVKVTLNFESNERLEFPNDGDEVDVPAEARRDLKVPVISKTPGDIPMRIVVRTPDGRRVLADRDSAVRSTAVSGLGLALMVGAGAFLALWWGRHWYRNRAVPRHARGRRRPPPEPSADPSSTTL